VGESPDDLLHGGAEVGPVGEDDVDIVELEALERGLHSLQKVLPGHPAVIGTLSSPEDLGGDDVITPLPAQLLQGVTHDPLGIAHVGAVGLGVVEEVDPALKGQLHALGAALQGEKESEEGGGRERKREKRAAARLCLPQISLHRFPRPQLEEKKKKKKKKKNKMKCQGDIRRREGIHGEDVAVGGHRSHLSKGGGKDRKFDLGGSHLLKKRPRDRRWIDRWGVLRLRAETFRPVLPR